MSNIEMNVRARSYFEILAEIEQLQAEAEAIRDSFKSLMVDREQEVLEGDGWRATWHNTNNSRFDSRRFKAEHQDLYSEYTIKSVGVRFTLNKIGEEARA